MRPAALLLLSALTLSAAGWQEIRSGPFLVFSDAGADPARDALNHLEQFRYALGQAFGRTELATAWPITVVVRKGVPASTALAFGRDGWYCNWPSRSAPPPDFFHNLALRFFEDNLAGRMPPGYEQALAAAYSTLAVDGVRVAFGAPPPPESRTPLWAMIHMLTVAPETSGRVRVLLSNLANGAEEGASYRNAFQQERPELETRARAYLAARSFGTRALNAKAFDAQRLPVREALPSRIRALPGDLLLAEGRLNEAVAAYQKGLNERPSPLLYEGYGLTLLGLKDLTAAATALSSAAADAEAAPARGLLELARLEKDSTRARALVERASKANSKWAEPYIVGASQEPGPVRKAALLKKAVELAPREVHLWRELAQAQTAAKQFDDATKSWLAAGRAAGSPEERERIIEARRASDQLRLDAAAEARRREADEKTAEIERLRLENEARIRAAEAKANKTSGEYKPARKVEPWWEGPKTESATGALTRIACTGTRATLHIQRDSGSPGAFAVPDIRKLAVIGAAEATLACGTQRRPRPVKIDFLPPKTKGALPEAVTIEFR